VTGGCAAPAACSLILPGDPQAAATRDPGPSGEPNPGPSSPNEPDSIFTANLKDVELTNRACFSLEELAAAAQQGIGRVRGEPELLVGFLHQAGLSL
jgi:hypothetical protein